MSGVSTVVQTRGNSLGTRYVDVMPGVSVYIKYTTSSLCKVHLPVTQPSWHTGGFVGNFQLIDLSPPNYPHFLSSFFPHFFLSLCTRKNFKHVQKWKKWLISPHVFIIQLHQLAIHSQNGFYQYFSPPPYDFEASCRFICKYFNLNIKYFNT